jgi:hypothetical protein
VKAVDVLEDERDEDDGEKESHERKTSNFKLQTPKKHQAPDSKGIDVFSVQYSVFSLQCSGFAL